MVNIAPNPFLFGATAGAILSGGSGKIFATHIGVLKVEVDWFDSNNIKYQMFIKPATCH